MGYGDQLIATGLARGAAERGKRVAFGDPNGRRIIWDGRSKEIFQGNPNIAPPGSEGGKNLEWVKFYKGHRGYNTQLAGVDSWTWNMKWRCKPGEVYFTDAERAEGASHGSGFTVIVPYIEAWKTGVSPNKDWGLKKYQALADILRAEGDELVQFSYDKAGPLLRGVRTIPTRGFRHAMSILANAQLYIGPEGGLHHAAAAFSLPGVVIFGDWIPPEVTGYAMHTNLTGTSGRYCGRHQACAHCRAAMDHITVEAVHRAVHGYLEEELSGAGATTPESCRVA